MRHGRSYTYAFFPKFTVMSPHNGLQPPCKGGFVGLAAGVRLFPVDGAMANRLPHPVPGKQ